MEPKRRVAITTARRDRCGTMARKVDLDAIMGGKQGIGTTDSDRGLVQVLGCFHEQVLGIGMDFVVCGHVLVTE